jgi:glycosyltransferase involved in cell wall biosynthesis
MTVSYLIITLYNKEQFIGGVMDSVLAEHAQTGGEIIVYDDCSTDRSPETVKERIVAHSARAACVRIFRGDENRGVSVATNRLIETATPPYIRLVDADDLLVPGSTGRLLLYLPRAA